MEPELEFYNIEVLYRPFVADGWTQVFSNEYIIWSHTKTCFEHKEYKFGIKLDNNIDYMLKTIFKSI